MDNWNRPLGFNSVSVIHSGFWCFDIPYMYLHKLSCIQVYKLQILSQKYILFCMLYTVAQWVHTLGRQYNLHCTYLSIGLVFIIFQLGFSNLLISIWCFLSGNNFLVSQMFALAKKVINHVYCYVACYVLSLFFVNTLGDNKSSCWPDFRWWGI